MKKLLFLLVLFLFSFSIFGQNKGEKFKHFEYKGKLYSFEVNDESHDDKRKLTISQANEYQNDTRTFSTVFNSGLRIVDNRKTEEKSYHVLLFYAENVNGYAWRTFPKDYLEVIFHFKDQSIEYHVRGNENGKRLNDKRSENPEKDMIKVFKEADFSEAYAEEIVIDYFIEHFNKLFVK